MPKYHRNPLKLYRNSPCDCESGRKHKHCCLPVEKRKLYAKYIKVRQFLKHPVDREMIQAGYKRKPRVQTHRVGVHYG